ncbi:2,3-dehydroadipyl-CoA hydratase [Gammaproteobacteria bacterium MOLA455]|nr:2,3-dehydroadipyl-CoA hydratase [Gammaproteobacteria bacterium MOLA455]
MSDQIQSRYADGILSVSFNRAEKKNALTSDMYAQLADIFDHRATQEDVNVVVLTGGRDFSAGNDLEDFLARPPTTGSDTTAPVWEFMRALSTCPVPVIAAVDGYAVGIGTTLLLHCEFVYSTPSTVFMLPFINLAAVPEFGSSLLMPMRCGYVKAAEMLLLGDRFDSATALQYNLINQICSSDNLMACAMTTAAKLAGKSRGALVQSKALMRRDMEPLAERISVESDAFAKRVASPEAKAAISAILKP